MPAEKSLGTAKRFGPRYGRTAKERVASVEKSLRRKHQCPFCHHTAVKRVAAGIWKCRKCHQKFTGKAYTPEITALKTKTQEAMGEPEEELAEETEQPEEGTEPEPAEPATEQQPGQSEKQKDINTS